MVRQRFAHVDQATVLPDRGVTRSDVVVWSDWMNRHDTGPSVK